MKYLPIAGTHSWNGRPDGEWWQWGSPFTEYLATLGWDLVCPSRPFIWTTDLGGIPWHRGRGHYDWQAAGENLYQYLRPALHSDDKYVEIQDRNLIAHSHALQVVAYACAAGLKVNRLITVMSPIRKDRMEDIYQAARPNIGHWLHLHADKDWTQIGGAMFDGAFGIYRQQPLADENVEVHGAGHSKLVRDPAWFLFWRAWLNGVAT